MPAQGTRASPLLASSEVFGKTQEAKGLCLSVSWPAESREGTFATMAVGPASMWITPPHCCRCCRECITITCISCLRTPAGKVMAKGFDTHMLGQKFRAGSSNWYKWSQMSCEAEKVLTMWHRDLRDSCAELSLSLLLAQSSNAVGQCLRSSHPFTSLPPSFISQVSRSTFAPRPSPPECCCGGASAGAWSTVQKASVNYTSVIPHQRTHSLTAYGRWTNTCQLSGAEREVDLFPELVTLISSSWSCKAECASVIFFFSDAAMLQWGPSPKAMGFLAWFYAEGRKGGGRHRCFP